MKKIQKPIFATVLFLFLIGGSLTVVFASPSITDVLSTWLQDKTDESIHEIDLEIQAEQEIQTERLKAALAEEIAKLEAEFEAFLHAEKEKRVKAIASYADERMQEIPEMVNEEGRKETIEAELEQILQEAMQAMDQVNMEIEEMDQVNMEIEEKEAEEPES